MLLACIMWVALFFNPEGVNFERTTNQSQSPSATSHATTSWYRKPVGAAFAWHHFAWYFAATGASGGEPCLHAWCAQLGPVRRRSLKVNDRNHN
jgi:hypothetical protein